MKLLNIRISGSFKPDLLLCECVKPLYTHWLHLTVLTAGGDREKTLLILFVVEAINEAF